MTCLWIVLCYCQVQWIKSLTALRYLSSFFMSRVNLDDLDMVKKGTVIPRVWWNLYLVNALAKLPVADSIALSSRMMEKCIPLEG